MPVKDDIDRRGFLSSVGKGLGLAALGSATIWFFRFCLATRFMARRLFEFFVLALPPHLWFGDYLVFSF